LIHKTAGFSEVKVFRFSSQTAAFLHVAHTTGLLPVLKQTFPQYRIYREIVPCSPKKADTFCRKSDILPV
jgi:hypothetical protein